MKIRVEFTTTEKVAMMNACNVASDNTAITKGSFGKASYNAKENFLEVDLKEAFMIDLIETYINLVKSFVNTLKIFKSAWFTDLVTEFPDKPKKEESKNEADESQNA